MKLEDMSSDEQRAFLRKHRKPFGARALLGKKYVQPDALPRLGAAIEKRARKALKRLEAQQPPAERIGPIVTGRIRELADSLKQERHREQ